LDEPKPGIAGADHPCASPSPSTGTRRVSLVEEHAAAVRIAAAEVARFAPAPERDEIAGWLWEPTRTLGQAA
jgi:hypothetical protein